MNWQKNFNYSDVIAQFGAQYPDQAQLADRLKDFTCFQLEQTHSAQVMHIRSADDFDIAPDADAMVTDQPGIALIIRTADCYPILFYDPLTRLIAAAHSGREGTRKNIAQAVISKMTDLGARPQNILAAVGPGISTSAYEVDIATWKKFCQSTNSTHHFPYLNIRQTITLQLEKAGLIPTNNFHQNQCTFSNENYYSFRRNATRNRQYNWIALR
jgi:purine-nucleoside/S-methyl-5'-thioadenosine phosphorylase / adenosine deaminase